MLTGVHQARKGDVGWGRPDRVAEVHVDSDCQNGARPSVAGSRITDSGVFVAFANRVSGGTAGVENQSVVDVNGVIISRITVEYVNGVVADAGCL